MNVLKTFARIVKARSKGGDVTVVANLRDSTELLKYMISLPETFIASIDIACSEISGYNGAYLVSLNPDGGIFCEPAVSDITGEVKRGGGLYLIDQTAIGEYLPEDFVLDSQKFKLIGEPQDD